MSRFPGSSRPESFSRRTRAGQLFERAGTPRGVATGLSIAPPVSADASAAAELLSAFGLIQHGANIAHGIANRAEIRAEREIARIERAKRLEENADRGLAAKEATLDILRLEQEIENGLAVDPNADPIEIIQARIAGEVEGRSDAYRERYESLMLERGVRTLSRYQSTLREENNAALAQTQMDRAAVSKDPEDIADAARQMIDLGYSEARAYQETAGRALSNAVETGDQEQFDAAVRALGGRFPDLVNRARNRLQDALIRQVERNQAQINDRAREDIAGALSADNPEAALAAVERWTGEADPTAILPLQRQAEALLRQHRQEAMLGTLLEVMASGAGPDELDAALDKAIEEGRLDAEMRDEAVADLRRERVEMMLALIERDPSRIDEVLESVDRAAQAMLERGPNTAAGLTAGQRNTIREAALGAADAQVEQGFRQQVVDAAVEMSTNARETGGLAALPDDVTVPLPSGRELTISRNEMQERVLSQAFAEIDAEHADDPKAAFDRKVSYLGENGVSYEPWRRRIMAGGLGLDSAFAARDEKGRIPELPVNVRGGYELYKQMYEASPEVANLHADESTRTKFRFAMLAEKYLTDGDADRALLTVAQMGYLSGLPTTSLSGVRDADIDAALDWAHVGGFNVLAQGVRDLIETVTFKRIDFERRGPRRKIANYDDIRRTTVRLAGILNRTIVPDAATALEQAAEMVRSRHTIIGETAVYTADAAVPRNIQPLADDVIGEYVRRYGETEGVRREDLFLMPPRSGVGWILWNSATNRPVDNWRQYTFTHADFAEMNRTAEAERETAPIDGGRRAEIAAAMLAQLKSELAAVKAERRQWWDSNQGFSLVKDAAYRARIEELERKIALHRRRALGAP